MRVGKPTLGFKVAVVVGLACAGLAACASVTNVDPQTDVSLGSYRAALVRIQSNMYTKIIPGMEDMKAQDLASPHPQHVAAWWDAKIGLVGDTCALTSDTLAGKNAGKPSK